MPELSSVLPSTSTQSDSSIRTDYEYTIQKSRFGLYTSVLTDGTKMTTALTEEACRVVTDNIRIPVMKGEYKGEENTLGSATVGGKL